MIRQFFIYVIDKGFDIGTRSSEIFSSSDFISHAMRPFFRFVVAKIHETSIWKEIY